MKETVDRFVDGLKSCSLPKQQNASRDRLALSDCRTMFG